MESQNRYKSLQNKSKYDWIQVMIKIFFSYIKSFIDVCVCYIEKKQKLYIVKV